MSMFDSMADGNSALLGGVALGRSLGEGIADMIIDGHERRMAERDAREEQSKWDQLIMVNKVNRARRISNATRIGALEKMLEARGVDIKGKDRTEYIRAMKEVIRYEREHSSEWYADMKQLKKEMPEEMPYITKEAEIAEEVV